MLSALVVTQRRERGPLKRDISSTLNHYTPSIPRLAKGLHRYHYFGTTSLLVSPPALPTAAGIIIFPTEATLSWGHIPDGS